MISRRRFSALLTAGAALGATGGFAIWRGSTYPISDDIRRSLVVLAPWQFLVINAVGRRVLAPAVFDVGPFVDRTLSTLAADDLRDLLRFVGWIEHGAPLANGHLSRFTELPASVQDRVLAALETSRYGALRAGFVALKALCTMSYYRQPSSWKEIGYDGPIVFRVGTP